MNTQITMEEMTFELRDEFNRKSIAEKIIKLLDAEIDVCPMAINGGWGTGKTEFCHKLINLINERDDQRPKDTDGDSQPQKRAVIYLNAFASETVDDPLLCILAAIRAKFHEEMKDRIFQLAMPVMKIFCKVVSNAFLVHVLKQTPEEISETAREGVKSLLDQTIDNLLDQYADAQKNLDALKSVIAVSAVKCPILFFIDELDRCRPDFALTILELVKHVFDIPGIKFIFVANMEQLKAIICKRYGQDVDSDVYLEKFFKTEITLSSKTKTKETENIHNSIILFDKYVKEHDMIQVEQQTLLRKFINILITKYNISLRNLQKITRLIEVYRCLSQEDCFKKKYQVGYSLIIILSIFIYAIDRDLSRDIMSGNIDINKISNFLKINDENLEKYIKLIIKMIKQGDKFYIDNMHNSEERFVFVDLWCAKFVDCPNTNAKDHLIKTVKLLNLQE